MVGILETAGERLAIDCDLPWVEELVREGASGQLTGWGGAAPSVRVRVEADRRPFDTRGWEVLARGAWRHDDELVMENACTAGFDLHLRCTPDQASFTYRWRPPTRERAAARLLRSRFHLLARAVLLQYPALWWAASRGRAPVHATACTVDGSNALVTAPSGVGRSTLVLQELDRGERATGDNLAVADGTRVWGLVEPLRVEGGDGRRMPHGRQELPMRDRVEALVPDVLVVLRRAASDDSSLAPCSPATAARALVTSTYMAGELRRYWAFAATLSAGSGMGPPHAPIAEVASAFAARLPCFVLALGRSRGVHLSELLSAEKEVAACA
jgi:hypothetical protein